nr:hypothetical protein [Ornithinimicrobium sp. F0845]
MRDQRAAARVLIRINRLAAGDPGDVKPVGKGVSELRVNFGPAIASTTCTTATRSSCS